MDNDILISYDFCMKYYSSFNFFSSKTYTKTGAGAGFGLPVFWKPFSIGKKGILGTCY